VFKPSEVPLIYPGFMRVSALLLLVAVVLASGCRTTHEATADEHAELNTVDGTLVATEGAGGDLGESMLGPLTTLFEPLTYLSDKDREEESSQYAMTQSDEITRMLTSGPIRFVGGEERAEWPGCVVEEEGRVEYQECVLGAEIAGILTAGLTVDGFYDWSDNTSASDLAFFAGADIVGIETGMSLDWAHDFVWTTEKFDGTFDLDYTSGLTLGGMRTSATVSLGVGATVEELTGSEDCDGPVAGLLDYRARMQTGTDPVERVRVTVEWLGCEDALITW